MQTALKKIPEVTLLFWVMKICATTLGETAGDLLAQTLNVGYGVSSLLLLGVFLVVLAAQLVVSRYIPALYWAVILATSTAGTTMSDYMDRTMGLGYATGSALLVTLLAVILGLWRLNEKPSRSVRLPLAGGSGFTGLPFYFSTRWARPWATIWPTTPA
ncbi:hypothetical protein [Hymenobacter sp. UYP22]|jgi:uncharacterized membrane-anchored protein|uniref:hypothetical protein n=1 Tax=Hymenobacter sp. UYP22 TaxID=3156348 RepID=UPI00112438D3